MGKRSRKRADGPVRAPVRAGGDIPRPDLPRAPRKPGQSRIDRFIEQADARPKPPWHPVPLVELSVLAGIGLIIFGMLNHTDRQGRIAIVFGVVLAAVAGLETAMREHFSGFRSHSALLASLPAVVVAFLLALARVAPALILVGALVTFAAGLFALRTRFKRRTGVGFKV